MPAIRSARQELEREASILEAVKARKPGLLFAEQPREFHDKLSTAASLNVDYIQGRARKKMPKLPDHVRLGAAETAFKNAVFGASMEHGMLTFEKFFSASLNWQNLGWLRKLSKTKTVSLDEETEGKQSLSEVLGEEDAIKAQRELAYSVQRIFQRVAGVRGFGDRHAELITRRLFFGEKQAAQAQRLGVSSTDVSSLVTRTRRKFERKLSEVKGKLDGNVFYSELFESIPFKSEEQERVFEEVLRSGGEDAAYLALVGSKFFGGSREKLLSSTQNILLSRRSAVRTYNSAVERFPLLGEKIEEARKPPGKREKRKWFDQKIYKRHLETARQLQARLQLKRPLRYGELVKAGHEATYGYFKDLKTGQLLPPEASNLVVIGSVPTRIPDEELRRRVLAKAAAGPIGIKETGFHKLLYVRPALLASLIAEEVIKPRYDTRSRVLEAIAFARNLEAELDRTPVYNDFRAKPGGISRYNLLWRVKNGRTKLAFDYVNLVNRHVNFPGTGPKPSKVAPLANSAVIEQKLSEIRAALSKSF